MYVIICSLLLLTALLVFIKKTKSEQAFIASFYELMKDRDILFVVSRLIHEVPDAGQDETIAGKRMRLKYSLLHLKLKQLVPNARLRSKVYAVVYLQIACIRSRRIENEKK